MSSSDADVVDQRKCFIHLSHLQWLKASLDFCAVYSPENLSRMGQNLFELKLRKRGTLRQYSKAAKKPKVKFSWLSHDFAATLQMYFFGAFRKLDRLKSVTNRIIL